MIMLPEGVRGNKRRKEDQLKIMNEIRKYLTIKNDYEIMKILGIPNSTFYRYKSRIYKEDKELLSKIMIEPLESRMLMIMRTLEESYRIFRQIMLDEKAKPMDRLKASKRMVNDQYNILKLLKMGPNANFEYNEII
jgi:ACT domain-containing protein